MRILRRQMLTYYLATHAVRGNQLLVNRAPFVCRVYFLHSSFHQSSCTCDLKCEWLEKYSPAMCSLSSEFWSSWQALLELECCDWLWFVVCILCFIVGKWEGWKRQGEILSGNTFAGVQGVWCSIVLAVVCPLVELELWSWDCHCAGIRGHMPRFMLLRLAYRNYKKGLLVSSAKCCKGHCVIKKKKVDD